jgi:hypothetical protein
MFHLRPTRYSPQQTDDSILEDSSIMRQLLRLGNKLSRTNQSLLLSCYTDFFSNPDFIILSHFDYIFIR